MKILFYTHAPRAFRTALIGNLYEIAQVYPVILLSEELDAETETALKNKELFPKLEKIIPVRQFTGSRISLLTKNNYLFKSAKNTIQQYKPDVLILASDVSSVLELYLARFAKRMNILVIAIQPFANAANADEGAKWVDLVNAYSRFPSFLPLWLRFFLIKSRKYFGHFLYYWILPLSVGEKPFFGKSSFVLRKGLNGMRDADYQIVFSAREYRIYRNTYLKYGIPVEKLFILSHPLIRETKEFFRKVYFNEAKKNRRDTKIASLMLPSENTIGFKRKDHSLVPNKEREKMWVEIIELISQILQGWKIFIKPHPDTKNIGKIKQGLESISENVKVVDPQEPADKYIEIGDIVIGLPLSATSTLFTALLQCPGKPIISLDFDEEILGDTYKNFQGIKYVDDKNEFANVLKSIRDSKYRIENNFSGTKNENLMANEFSNTVEMLECLFKKNYAAKLIAPQN